MKAKKAVPVLAIVTLFALISPIVSGCGSGSPLEATKSLLRSFSKGDWEGFMKAILPDRVRSMTQEDINSWKGALESIDFDVGQLKFEVKPEGENSAIVEIVGGNIKFKKAKPGGGTLDVTKMTMTYVDPGTKKLQVEQIKGEDAESVRQNILRYRTKKFKGRWYVDFPLAETS